MVALAIVVPTSQLVDCSVIAEPVINISKNLIVVEKTMKTSSMMMMMTAVFELLNLSFSVAVPSQRIVLLDREQ